MRLVCRVAIAGALSACLLASPVRARDASANDAPGEARDATRAALTSQGSGEPATSDASADAIAETTADGSLDALVPDVARDPWKLSPGTRPFAGRFTFGAAYGSLGDHRLYALCAAYSPSAWLSWEAAIGHNPGDAVHALFHTLSAHVRHPLPWRLQPYGTIGFGQAMVFPGTSMNADPVTENVLTVGGGLEIYIRDDVALRGEVRQATVFGPERGSERTARYDYAEATIGLAFHRRVRN